MHFLSYGFNFDGSTPKMTVEKFPEMCSQSQGRTRAPKTGPTRGLSNVLDAPRSQNGPKMAFGGSSSVHEIN